MDSGPPSTGRPSGTLTTESPSNQKPSNTSLPEEDGVPIPVRVVATSPRPAAPSEPPQAPAALPRTGRTERGEPISVLSGTTQGVEWKVGIVLNDGVLLPVLEFSRAVPQDHPAVMEAYLGLVRCFQGVLGEAWSAKAMCPVCHLPSISPSACECCDQPMCHFCRLRHAQGHGIPGTGEPSGSVAASSGARTERSGPKDLPGYA